MHEKLRFRLEERLRVNCAITIFIVRICVALLPFRYLIRLVQLQSKPTIPPPSDKYAIIAATVRIVKFYTNHLNGACLVRSAATAIVLGRWGVENVIRIGATFNADGKLCGHAWVTVGERVVIGGSESVALYQEVRVAGDAVR